MLPPIRVLLVEDDPSARLLLSAALAAQPGLELCGQAADGLEGLELVERCRPDAVLLDLIMPGMDGLGFLRALDRRDRPTVVVASQAGGREVIRCALSLGASYYLVKPVNVQALPDLLAGLCLGPLVRRGEALLADMGASGRGLPAAAQAAAVLAREPGALLKQAYAPAIAAEGSSYAVVERNIRRMVGALHQAAPPGYLALMGGRPERRPSNLAFLRALAGALEAEGQRPGFLFPDFP